MFHAVKSLDFHVEHAISLLPAALKERRKLPLRIICNARKEQATSS
jgi:hypothetical protein